MPFSVRAFFTGLTGLAMIMIWPMVLGPWILITTGFIAGFLAIMGPRQIRDAWQFWFGSDLVVYDLVAVGQTDTRSGWQVRFLGHIKKEY